MKNVKLIIDSPQKNSSLIYKTNYYCLDPIIYLEIDNKKIGFFPSTEFEKAKKKASLDEIYNLTEELNNLKLENNKFYPLKSSIIIKKYKEIKDIYVPESFPIIEADNLRNNNINLYPIQEPFFKERISKNENEIEIIRNNCKKLNIVLDEVKNILGSSIITNSKRLVYNGEILTSEFLQSFIIKSLFDKRLITDSVIVACGNQGCDPHETGYGDIIANESIIIDIYPRNQDNYYFSDVTRTFCKGKPKQELIKIYNIVKENQERTIDILHKGVIGREIHNKVEAFFIDKGYKTGIIDGVLQGFFHGTGHGLGLDCHEPPYISKFGDIIENNCVVSVEPGLYYLNIGGVRIEDLVVVRDNYAENLTNYEKKFIIE